MTDLDDIPGDPGPPVVGHTVRIQRDPLGWGLSRYARYGAVSWSRAWGTTVVNLVGADAVATALTNRDGAFANGPGWGPFLEPFFTRGLMLLDFDEHRHHRRIMAEAFTPRRLAAYHASAAARVASTVDSWTTGELALFPEIKRLSLDIATETFTGTPLEDSPTIRHAFTDAVRAGSTPVRLPLPGSRWARGLRGRSVLERYLRAQLPAARTSDRGDLLSALCHATTETGDRFTDRDVVDHMIFLLMAAHDTSTAALVATAFHLGRHPDWQERARAEADAAGELTGPSAVDRLAVLDRIVKEALRLNTPVPVLARRTVAETVVGGRRIPADTICSVGLHVTHHMPEYWHDPEAFDPDRFAGPLPHPYAWRPFGGGAHTCIGMRFAMLEIKTILFTMLRRYRWTLRPGYRLHIDYTTVPVPRDGLPVLLAAR
jgi:cytochrome P450